MLEDLNIVEIGRPFVKYVFPKNTRCYSSKIYAYRDGSDFEPFRTLYSALRDPKVDLVICHPRRTSPWNAAWWLRQMGMRRFLKGYIPTTSLLGPQFLRLKPKAPVAVVDLEDNRYIPKCDTFLFDHCQAWFKRELPVDRWQVFMRTHHYGLPTTRYRRNAKNRSRMNKLRPLPLGAMLHTAHQLPDSPSAKTTDIFFAGSVLGSSSVREDGLRAMKQLEQLGYKVDVPEQPLPFPEFVRRASEAHLVWSPEGYGWDCFRHYEAALCWSVPLVNYPTVLRYKPFEDGQHAIFYDPSADGLVKAARRALADRDRLVQMGLAARAHCLKYHSLEASVRHVIEATLALARGESRLENDAEETHRPLVNHAA